MTEPFLMRLYQFDSLSDVWSARRDNDYSARAMWQTGTGNEPPGSVHQRLQLRHVRHAEERRKPDSGRENTVTAYYCITQHNCGWWVTPILGLPNSRTSTLPSLTVAVIKTQIRYLLGLSSGSVASLLLLL